MRLRIAPRWDRPGIRALLADPDAAGGQSPRVLKTDATTTLWVAPVGDPAWVVKRYNTRGAWHAVKRSLRRTRAANCWRMAHLFLARGIPTAPPVALVERRHAFLAGRSWFINEFVEGELLSDLLRGRTDLGGMEELAERVVGLFGKLQANRFSHGDMKATNILVANGVPMLLDLDASRRHRLAMSHRRALARDRRRFLRNWDEQPKIRRWFAARLGALQI